MSCRLQVYTVVVGQVSTSRCHLLLRCDYNTVDRFPMIRLLFLWWSIPEREAGAPHAPSPTPLTPLALWQPSVYSPHLWVWEKRPICPLNHTILSVNGAKCSCCLSLKKRVHFLCIVGSRWTSPLLTVPCKKTSPKPKYDMIPET